MSFVTFTPPEAFKSLTEAMQRRRQQADQEHLMVNQANSSDHLSKAGKGKSKKSFFLVIAFGEDDTVDSRHARKKHRGCQTQIQNASRCQSATAQLLLDTRPWHEPRVRPRARPRALAKDCATLIILEERVPLFWGEHQRAASE